MIEFQDISKYNKQNLKDLKTKEYRKKTKIKKVWKTLYNLCKVTKNSPIKSEQSVHSGEYLFVTNFPSDRMSSILQHWSNIFQYFVFPRCTAGKTMFIVTVCFYQQQCCCCWPYNGRTLPLAPKSILEEARKNPRGVCSFPQVIACSWAFSKAKKYALQVGQRGTRGFELAAIFVVYKQSARRSELPPNPLASHATLREAFCHFVHLISLRNARCALPKWTHGLFTLFPEDWVGEPITVSQEFVHSPKLNSKLPRNSIH